MWKYPWGYKEGFAIKDDLATIVFIYFKGNKIKYTKTIIDTLKSFGFDITIEIKEKNSSSAIASAFV